LEDFVKWYRILICFEAGLDPDLTGVNPGVAYPGYGSGMEKNSGSRMNISIIFLRVKKIA
jgi:hypothetical protein